MVSKTVKDYLDENYEEVLIGFMIELNEQNVSARDIGRELAKITELMRCRDA